MREVAVIGVGFSEWGEVWKKSMRDIFVEAALDAIKDAGVDKIDSMYVGCMTSGLFVGQEHLGSILSDYLGVSGIPASRVESACASGGVAFRQGLMDVASGMNDIVLVGGVEKMTDVGGDGARILRRAHRPGVAGREFRGETDRATGVRLGAGRRRDGCR